MWGLKSDIRRKAWSDCHIYYNVKETLFFYPIRAQDLYYAQWRGEKARKNPLMVSSRVCIPLDHKWVEICMLMYYVLLCADDP
jgi:hypothetical protein